MIILFIYSFFQQLSKRHSGGGGGGGRGGSDDGGGGGGSDGGGDGGGDGGKEELPLTSTLTCVRYTFPVIDRRGRGRGAVEEGGGRSAYI